MEIKQIIVTLRGTKGEAVKAVFDPSGAVLSGDGVACKKALKALVPVPKPIDPPLWDSETPNASPEHKTLFSSDS